jgi:hypothetical protein
MIKNLSKLTTLVKVRILFQNKSSLFFPSSTFKNPKESYKEIAHPGSFWTPLVTITGGRRDRGRGGSGLQFCYVFLCLPSMLEILKCFDFCKTLFCFHCFVLNF